jgi:GT2 family glycosyltransferase
MTYLDPEKASEVDSLSGACLMVRQEVIENVGIMDEAYIMYGDDLDWCYRIKKAGWKIYYVPDARIVHYGGMGGSRVLPYRNIWEFHRSMVIFYKKHYAKNYTALLNWCIYGIIFAKGIVDLVVNFLRKEKIVGSRKPQASSQPT